MQALPTGYLLDLAIGILAGHVGNVRHLDAWDKMARDGVTPLAATMSSGELPVA